MKTRDPRGFLVATLIGLGVASCNQAPPAATQYKESRGTISGAIPQEQSDNVTQQPPTNQDTTVDPEALALQGQEIFDTKCIGCHDIENSGINIQGSEAGEIVRAANLDAHSTLDWVSDTEAEAVEAHLISNSGI